MNTVLKNVKIESPKAEKRRAGLYMDKALHDQVAAIAEQNDMPLNVVLIHFIEKGLEAALSEQ